MTRVRRLQWGPRSAAVQLSICRLFLYIIFHVDITNLLWPSTPVPDSDRLLTTSRWPYQFDTHRDGAEQWDRLPPANGRSSSIGKRNGHRSTREVASSQFDVTIRHFPEASQIPTNAKRCDPDGLTRTPLEFDFSRSTNGRSPLVRKRPKIRSSSTTFGQLRVVKDSI